MKCSPCKSLCKSLLLKRSCTVLEKVHSDNPVICLADETTVRAVVIEIYQHLPTNRNRGFNNKSSRLRLISGVSQKVIWHACSSLHSFLRCLILSLCFSSRCIFVMFSGASFVCISRLCIPWTRKRSPHFLKRSVCSTRGKLMGWVYNCTAFFSRMIFFALFKGHIYRRNINMEWWQALSLIYSHTKHFVSGSCSWTAWDWARRSSVMAASTHLVSDEQGTSAWQSCSSHVLILLCFPPLWWSFCHSLDEWNQFFLPSDMT